MENTVADRFVGEACREGDEVTLNIEVTDANDALSFVRAIHNGKSVSGVRVHSWSLFDTSKAIEIRDSLVREEVQRHHDKMEELMNPRNLRGFAQRDKKQQRTG